MSITTVLPDAPPEELARLLPAGNVAVLGGPGSGKTALLEAALLAPVGPTGRGPLPRPPPAAPPRRGRGAAGGRGGAAPGGGLAPGGWRGATPTYSTTVASHGC